jgi:peptidoglycan/xylan/chitin deacetylase (PgdA/CDA1 family)
MRHHVGLFVILSLIFSGCVSSAAAPRVEKLTRPSQISPPTQTISSSPTAVPLKKTPSESDLEFSNLPTQKATISPTNTPTATPLPTWSWNEAGMVRAPILLYHHVSDSVQGSRYYVSTENFEKQMHRLQELGYTPIPLSLLVDALLNGAELPQRPVVITFDDGPEDIYEKAFPIMRALGYPGVVFIVANRLESEGFLNIEQLSEMIASGWEVGSHGMTHTDITLAHGSVRNEILQSRLDLDRSLGITVTTFAYPFGKIDPYVGEKVSDYGYEAAVGLGKSWQHSLATLYYLNRIEIHGEFDLAEFDSKLPWVKNTANPPQKTPMGND